MHPHEYDSGFGFHNDGNWESHHYDGIHVSEEPNVGNQEVLDLKMISELYAAAEADRQVPKFY